jgi:hypothetical protein
MIMRRNNIKGFWEEPYMNRTKVLIGALIFVSSFSFSLDLSTGYGLITGASFDTLSCTVNDGAAVSRQRYNQFHFGGLVFFDATYIAAHISFYGTSTTFSYNPEIKRYTFVDDNYQLIGTNLGLGVRFKYPFNINEIKIFPLLGFQGSFGLSQNFAKDSGSGSAKKGINYGNAASWTTFVIEAGAGFDVDISDRMFFRGNIVINYKMNSELDNAFIKAVRDAGNPETANLNLGFEINLLIGYKIGESSLRPRQRSESSPPKQSGDDDLFYPK